MSDVKYCKNKLDSFDRVLQNILSFDFVNVPDKDYKKKTAFHNLELPSLPPAGPSSQGSGYRGCPPTPCTPSPHLLVLVLRALATEAASHLCLPVTFQNRFLPCACDLPDPGLCTALPCCTLVSG